MDGHSVYESVDPQYAPGPPYPPMDYIEAYRFDRIIREEMRGMSKKEKDAYLKNLYGYTEPSPEEIAMQEAKNNIPKLIEDRIRQLERDYFHLREFLHGYDLYIEAMKYVEEYKDEEVPFEW